jgi:membrane protein DedA with SNARE-associated domain
MELLDTLIHDVVASPWVLAIMFLIALVDGFFPPVPSETILVAGVAVAATTGDVLTIVLLCAAATGGAILGDNVAYLIGRAVGAERFQWMRTPRALSGLERARTALETRGAVFLIGARYIPVGRVAANMSAGALAYPRRRFVLLSCVGGFSWAAFNAVLGTIAGSWVQDQPLLGAAIAIVVAALIGLTVDRFITGRRKTPAALAG